MTQQEFETRTGLSYNTEDFELINRIYLAAGEINKDLFCDEFKKDPKILDNSIAIGMLLRVEALEEAYDKLMKEYSDLETQLDAARKNMEAYRKQIDIADAKVGRLQSLVDATLEEVNLACNKELKEVFELKMGKIETMRLRKEAGWPLSSEDIDYLLDHCVEK